MTIAPPITPTAATFPAPAAIINLDITITSIGPSLGDCYTGKSIVN